MRDREPTVRSRELGDGLRAAMRSAGLSGREMARRLGWSDSRVSRLLAGTRGGSEVNIASFLAICGVKGRERERLLRLCKEQHKPGWHQQHGSTLPKQVKTLIDHENRASRIGDFQIHLVPGLLQTGDYARAVMIGSGAVPADEINDRVAARLARKNLFSRTPRPEISFYIHEFVLHLPVGGAQVMFEQLHELLRLSVRPYLTLRVVPAIMGAHAAHAGSFKLMDFPEFKPVAYMESETSSLFLELPEEIASYRRILAALEDIALDEGQSRQLIGKLAVELYGSDQESHDRVAEEQL